MNSRLATGAEENTHLHADRQGKLSFRRIYRIWSLTNAGVVVGLVVLSEIAPLSPFALAALTVWSGVAVALLFLFGKQRHPDGSGPAIPNLLTTTRLIAAVLVLALTAADTVYPIVGRMIRSSVGWILVAALLVVELTDFFDGRLARRMDSGGFGAVWDMENDVVYALALSLLLRHVHEVAIFVLLIGTMRFLYVLLWHYESEPATVPRVYKLYAKTTAALIATTLIVAVVPIVGPRLRTGALAGILVMQMISFGWDLVLQRR